MYIIPGLILAAALFATQQGGASSAYGSVHPSPEDANLEAARLSVLRWALSIFDIEHIEPISDQFDSDLEFIQRGGLGQIYGVEINYSAVPGGFRQTQVETARIAQEHGLSNLQYVVRPSLGHKTAVVIFAHDPIRAFHYIMRKKRSTNYGNVGASPMNAGGGQDGGQGYGAHYGSLLNSLKALDGQIFSITKKLVGTFRGAKLYAKKAVLSQLNAQRDTLLSQGLSPSSPQVLHLDQQFRNIIGSVIGTILTTQLETALRPFKARRDAMIQAIGSQGLVTDWTAYGALYGQDSDPNAFMDTAEYQDWLAALKENKKEITALDQAEGLLIITIESFKTQVRDYIPQVHSFDVRGGQDEDGQRYAAVTLSTTDPYGVLQQAVNYAIQIAGTQGIVVTTEPSEDDEKVVLIFSQGTVPESFGDDYEAEGYAYMAPEQMGY